MNGVDAKPSQCSIVIWEWGPGVERKQTARNCKGSPDASQNQSCGKVGALFGSSNFLSRSCKSPGKLPGLQVMDGVNDALTSFGPLDREWCSTVEGNLGGVA